MRWCIEEEKADKEEKKALEDRISHTEILSKDLKKIYDAFPIHDTGLKNWVEGGYVLPSSSPPQNIWIQKRSKEAF